MKYELKRIDIWPIVKIVFIFSLLFGFFIGVLYAGMFLLLDLFANLAEAGYEEMGSLGSGFAVIILLACTAGVTIVHTVGAVIVVVLYNLLAGAIGGLRFDLQTIESVIEGKDTAG